MLVCPLLAPWEPRFVSKPQPSSEGETGATRTAVPADPRRNPTYPTRQHLHEKGHWQGVLANAEAQIAPFSQRLNLLGDDPKRPTLEKLHAQMLGARDQIADAVRRLPGETGDLYEEDKHRVEEAIVALDRLAQRW